MTRVHRFVFLWILTAAFAVSAQAQSRMNFPRLLSPRDLSTTGFAFVNTSSAPVTVTLNSYSADGLLAGQSFLTVPAKGQTAKLASEVLGISKEAWVQVVSPNS